MKSKKFDLLRPARKSILLALCVNVAACASNAPVPPVAAASQPSPYQDIVPLQNNGQTGVWMTEQALEDILVGVVREKGDLKVKLAATEIERDMARAAEETMRKIGLYAEFRATWLPVITFVGGVVVALGISVGAYLLAR